MEEICTGCHGTGLVKAGGQKITHDLCSGRGKVVLDTPPVPSSQEDDSKKNELD